MGWGFELNLGLRRFRLELCETENLWEMRKGPPVLRKESLVCHYSLRRCLNRPWHCQAKPVWDLEDLSANHNQDRLCFLEQEEGGSSR